MNYNITDKIVIITGAGSGIGEATARHLGRQGASLLLAGRRKDCLENVAGDIRSAGGTAEIAVTDVTIKHNVEEMINTAIRHFNRIDVLVNNAGLMSIAPLTEIKTDEWDRMIDINIKGVLYGIAAVLPIFRQQNCGHFINIASVAGIKVFSPGGAVYSGTKYAVRAITEGLRYEVGEKIRTTIISPGAVDSELKYGTSHKESADFVNGFYEIAISSDAVAKAISYAIEQPAEVDVNEIILRPSIQEF